MPDLSFPASTAPSRFVESGGRLVNIYAEKLQDGRIAYRTTAGLREVANITGYANCRGFIYVGSTLLAVMGDRVFSVVEASGGAYTITNLGELAGNGRVFLARNNKQPTPDVIAVTGGSAYELSLTGAPVTYTDSDVGSPNSVDFQGGYFVFSYGNGEMRSTGLNSVAINTLDYATAERKADFLYRVFSLGDTLYAVGESTIECWRIDANNAEGFPFSYVTTIDRGVVGADAICGNDLGWSGAGVFVGNDNIIYRISGYQIEKISTPPLERLIENCANRSAIRSLVYAHSGHSFVDITSDDWTLVYDFSTGAWHERKSYGANNWRAKSSVRAFGKWLVGDTTTGKIFEVDEDCYNDGGDPLVYLLEGTIAKSFPNRVAIPRLDIDAMYGVGSGSGSMAIYDNPQMMISWSLDGGVTWTPPTNRGFGAQGNYRSTIRVNRLGLAAPAGFRVRLSGSDPAPVTIFGASIEVQQRF